MSFSEKIAEFLATPEVQAIISAVIAYISANLVAWIGMGVKAIVTKNKQIKMQEDYDEKIANLTASYNSMAAKYYKDMGDSIKQLEQSGLLNKATTKDANRSLIFLIIIILYSEGPETLKHKSTSLNSNFVIPTELK